MEGYVIRNRETGALLGIPATTGKAGLKSVAYWESEGLALKALRRRASEKSIRSIHEWDVIPLAKFTS